MSHAAGCPHCTEDAPGQLERLRCEPDRGAPPGAMVETWLCNTCARPFRRRVSEEDGIAGHSLTGRGERRTRG